MTSIECQSIWNTKGTNYKFTQINMTQPSSTLNIMNHWLKDQVDYLSAALEKSSLYIMPNSVSARCISETDDSCMYIITPDNLEYFARDDDGKMFLYRYRIWDFICGRDDDMQSSTNFYVSDRLITNDEFINETTKSMKGLDKISKRLLFSNIELSILLR